VIRDAVLHITNEQPLLADLVDRPGPNDTILVCTNLRQLNGKRPIWIDESDSVFYFPYSLIRFIEIHPDSEGAVALPSGREEKPAPRGGPRKAAPPAPAPEPELEIDEELLRRVRDV
jgi:hypothetical protein